MNSIELCGNVCEVHSFNDRLWIVNLMVHLNHLDLLTFFTQVKDGPHTIVHEHTPNY